MSFSNISNDLINKNLSYDMRVLLNKKYFDNSNILAEYYFFTVFL